MNLQTNRRLLHHEADFEEVSRQIRWITIALTAVTFPYNHPAALWVLALVGLAAAYNLARYAPAVMRLPLFASRVTMLLFDNAFVLTLLLFVGTTGTPYTGFLVFMIVSAAYWYGLKGCLALIAGQSALVALALWVHPFAAISLDPWHSALLSILVLTTIGIFVARITKAERNERVILKRLAGDRQAEEERLFALINSLNDAVLVADAKGRILIANGAAEAMSGIPGNLRGKDISQAFPVYTPTKGRQSLFELMKASPNPQRRRDLAMMSVDGTELSLDLTVTPVQLGTQKSTNYIVICQDITKEKSLDQQREEFISVASHELRTPLTIIEAALSQAMLPGNELKPELVTLLDQAHRNTVFLGGLVKDLTTLSQIQNDSIPIQLKPVNPRALLEQLVKDFAAQAEQKQLSIKSVVLPDTPTVLSTEHHIREILQNYVSNALKYTQDGGITLKAEPAKNGGVLFAVQDTGIGISASDQKHLFTKFYRSEDYRTRETGGTGLGLYLCLELSQRLNARVWCQSTLNQGSVFYLEVPPFSQLQRDHAKVVEAEVSTLIDQL